MLALKQIKILVPKAEHFQEFDIDRIGPWCEVTEQPKLATGSNRDLLNTELHYSMAPTIVHFHQLGVSRKLQKS